MKKLFLLAIVALGFTAVSFGQSAEAKATLQASHTIGAGTALSFGSFALTGAGFIEVSSAGVFVDSEGIAAEPTGITGSVFHITGGAGEAFHVTLPGELKIAIGGSALANRTMEVNTWTTNVSTNSAAQTPLTGGAADIFVGAKLNFDGFEVPGSYTGNYSITVNWN